MAFSIYDASVPICAQQLGALAVIAGKAADHCATNKIEERAADRPAVSGHVLPARQVPSGGGFGRMTRAVWPASLDRNLRRGRHQLCGREKALRGSVAFINSLTRAQIEGSEDKSFLDAGANERKMKGIDTCGNSLCRTSFSLHNRVRHSAASRRSDR